MHGQPQKLQELGGFNIGDRVKLKIKGIEQDHIGVINSFNARGEFKVKVKQPTCQEGNGIWNVWLEELERVS